MAEGLPLSNWILRESLAKQFAEVRRRALALSLGACLLAIGAALALDLLGADVLVLPSALLVLGLMAFGLLEMRRRVGTALGRATVTSVWLARRGILDPDGRPTTRLFETMQRLNSAPDSAESTAELVTTTSGDRSEELAVAAYLEAHRRYAAGESWLGPLADVSSVIDSAELADELREVTRSRSRWFWMVVGPLAVVGAALLLLAAMDLVRFLR